MFSINFSKSFAGGNGKVPPSNDAKGKKTRDAGGNGKTPPTSDAKRKGKK